MKTKEYPKKENELYAQLPAPTKSPKTMIGLTKNGVPEKSDTRGNMALWGTVALWYMMDDVEKIDEVKYKLKKKIIKIET